MTTNPQSNAARFRTVRMEAFSDGVFAIAITLLVLEIAVPTGSEDDLLGALRAQWPSCLAYFVSFSTIGVVWFAHTVITEYLDHADAVLIRLNLILLLVVCSSPSRPGCWPSTPATPKPSARPRRSTGSTCSSR